MGACFCCSEKQRILILPSEEEIKTFDSADEDFALITNATNAFEALRTISAISSEAKASLSTSGDTEKQLLAVKSLEPSIQLISDAYHFTNPICNSIVSTLKHCISNLEWTEDKRCIHKLMSLLQCCIVFDSIKLSNPLISNTLFFYRRCSPSVASIYTLPLSENECSEIISFLAEPQPLQTLLFSQLAELKSQSSSVISALTYLCNSIVYTIESTKCDNPDLQRLYYQSLTAVLILMDTIQIGGIFKKGSGVDIVRAIRALCLWEHLSRDCLLIIRYGSQTFGNPTTMSSVKKMVIQVTK